MIWALGACVALLGAPSAADALRPRPVDSKRYFESTTVLVLADDGTYVQGLVAVSNIGLGNGQGACRLLWAAPGSKPAQWAKPVDAGAWHFAALPVPTLAMGPCQLAATGSGVQLDINLDDVQVSMTLHAPAQPRTPPGMPLPLQEGMYETELLVPFAPAEVVLVRDGSAPQILRGFGYADHARSTALPRDMGRGAARFRGFAPGCSVILYARFTEDSVSGFVWRQGHSAPEALTGWQALLPPPDAANTAVMLRPPRGDPWRLRIGPRWFRAAPLEDYGVFGRLVGAWMGSMVNETYGAVLHAGNECPRVLGVLEVDHNS